MGMYQVLFLNTHVRFSSGNLRLPTRSYIPQIGRQNTLLPSQKLNVAMENPHFNGIYIPGKVGIFMGYVSFREGTTPKTKRST